MKDDRIISIEAKTKIYHRPGCQHAKRILYKNRMRITKKEAREQGYRPCKCCNNLNHIYKQEQGVISFYERKKKMEFKYRDRALYVKTPISCWKIVYSRKREMLALYHRNAGRNPINWGMVQHEAYHRQEDAPYRPFLDSYLEYIYEHDKFREAEMRGDENIKYSCKKYEKIAAKSKWRKDLRRVNNLFRMLEAQNSGYKELSYC